MIEYQLGTCWSIFDGPPVDQQYWDDWISIILISNIHFGKNACSNNCFAVVKYGGHISIFLLTINTYKPSVIGHQCFYQLVVGHSYEPWWYKLYLLTNQSPSWPGFLYNELSCTHGFPSPKMDGFTDLICILCALTPFTLIQTGLQFASIYSKSYYGFLVSLLINCLNLFDSHTALYNFRQCNQFVSQKLLGAHRALVKKVLTSRYSVKQTVSQNCYWQWTFINN